MSHVAMWMWPLAPHRGRSGAGGGEAVYSRIPSRTGDKSSICNVNDVYIYYKHIYRTVQVEVESVIVLVLTSKCYPSGVSRHRGDVLEFLDHLIDESSCGATRRTPTVTGLNGGLSA